MTADLVVSLFGVLLITGALLAIRLRSASASRRRIEQMRAATKLLGRHAETMERFLDDPAAPPVLKLGLLELSDAMADRAFVGTLAESMAASDPVAPSTGEIGAAVTRLRAESPAAFQTFNEATIAGTFAGLLRWPETAALSEQVMAQLVAEPQREVDMLVSAARWRMAHGAAPAPA